MWRGTGTGIRMERCGEEKNRRLKFRIKKSIPRSLPSVEHATRDDLRSCIERIAGAHRRAVERRKHIARCTPMNNIFRRCFLLISSFLFLSLPLSRYITPLFVSETLILVLPWLTFHVLQLSYDSFILLLKTISRKCDDVGCCYVSF